MRGGMLYRWKVRIKKVKRSVMEQDTRTSIPHSEQLLRVLPVPLPTQRPRHRKAEFEADVFSGFDEAVAALASGGCVGCVLFV